jgi:hypothetical protein
VLVLSELNTRLGGIQEVYPGLVYAGADIFSSSGSATLPGLPVLNNLSARGGVRFSGVDISAYANNLTNAHPLMFESRDTAPYALGPGTNGGTGPTTDTLYFGRGVRPRTIGVTASYRY